MSEGERRRKAPTTPVPTSTLEDMRDLVSRTHANVNMLRKEILPPLIDDTRNARDTAREALQGLNEHRTNETIHSHGCIEQERQKEQDDDIDSLQNQVSDTKTIASSALVHVNNTNRILWWIIGVSGTVIAAAIVFAISVRVSTTEHKSHIEINRANITEHDQEIRVIRDNFMKEIRKLPAEVTRAARSVPPPKPSMDVEDMKQIVDGFEMTEYEKRTVHRILKRVQQREAKNGVR